MTVEGSKKGKIDGSIQEKIDSIKSKTKEKKHKIPNGFFINNCFNANTDKDLTENHIKYVLQFLNILIYTSLNYLLIRIVCFLLQFFEKLTTENLKKLSFSKKKKICLKLYC